MRTSRLDAQLQTQLGQPIPWADQRHGQTLIWMVMGVICALIYQSAKVVIQSYSCRVCSKSSTTIQPLAAQPSDQ